MAWGGPDGQLAQIREQSKDSDKLALTDEVNGLIEGLKISLGWLSDRDKEIATDNPDILGDDLYRLARGGLRNTLGAVNFLSDVAIKSSEGKLNDPIGAASIVGHGLRLADFATKKSGEIGGAIAEHGFGVDPRVGQAIGSFAPDLLLSRGAGTLSKLSKGLRIGTPTGRAFAIAGGYGGVPAATMMNIPDLGRPLQMVAGTSAATKVIDATTGYKNSDEWYTAAKKLHTEGLSAKQIRDRVGKFKDEATGQRWTIHQTGRGKGITRIDLDITRANREANNLRRAQEQTGDYFNAYKQDRGLKEQARLLDSPEGRGQIHHMRPKVVIDAILHGSTGTEREILLSLSHDVFGGIGDTLGNMQVLSHRNHKIVHAMLKENGFDQSVMKLQNFEKLTGAQRIEALYDLREVVLEANTFVLKKRAQDLAQELNSNRYKSINL